MAPIIDVNADLYARTDIERVGVAPLTSMFWYGENDRRYATDWRPEIHDSDGLAMWTGVGEHIWRPLNNGPMVRTNTFSDASPKGFGLMQRDRDFAEYQDDGAFYNKRPGIWVEPIGEWGEGAVQLVEIPTKDETNDNIVAYWVPKKPVRAGDELAYAYKLYWQNDEPHPPVNIGRVVSTHSGAGGVPGVPHPNDDDKRKFVIDFAGGPLSEHGAALRRDADGLAFARTHRQRLRRQGRRHRPLARAVRPDDRRRWPGRPTLLPAPRRRDPLRDVDVPMEPESVS